jgi:hypothetical protein
MNICMFSPFSFSMESSTHRLVSFAEELVKSGNEVCTILSSFDRHSDFNAQKLDSNDHDQGKKLKERRFTQAF